MTEQQRNQMHIAETLCKSVGADELTHSMVNKVKYVYNFLKPAVIAADPTIGSLYYIVYKTINTGEIFGEYVVIWGVHGDCMAFIDVTADSLPALARDVFKWI